MIYRLIEPLASMGHSSIRKLICAISVCNTLTVGVHLSSTPSISGPGSATENNNFRKMKNYMKVEGFRKVFFSKLMLKTSFRNPFFFCKNRVPKH